MMNVSLVPEFLTYDPYRPVNWREEIADSLFSEGRRPNARYHDEPIRSYTQCLYWNRSVRPTVRNRVLRTHPDIFLAHRLCKDDPVDNCAMIKARILARQPIDAVALATATKPRVIRRFMELFFDVEDRLDCHDYILTQIVGRPADNVTDTWNRETPQMRHIFWQLVGYLMGWRMLDYMLTGILPRATASQESEVVAGMADIAYADKVRQRALHTAHTVPIYRYNAVELLDLQYRLMSLAQEKNTSGGGSADQYLTELKLLIVHLQTALANPSDNPALQEASKAMTELRALEFREAQNGHLPESFLEREQWSRERCPPVVPTDAIPPEVAAAGVQ